MTSKLPPLPEPHGESVHRGHLIKFTDHQMQAYGQACRDAALEEAAQRGDGMMKLTEAVAELRSLK